MNGDIKPIRCANCNRFLGFEMMIEGMIFPYCPNCHQFNELRTEGYTPPLTTNEIYAILTQQRTKGH